MTANSSLPAKAPVQSGGALAAFNPRDLEQAWRLAEMVAKTGGDLVPSAYRGQPGAVLMAMQRGFELGIPWMTALQWIAPINGRPCLWGDALPALVQRAGHRLTEWREGEGKNMVAFCKVTRRDGHETTQSFSVDDAKRAGLWSPEEKVTRRRKDGTKYEVANDSPWHRYWPRMLQMRARGFAVRDGAADVLLGLSVAEEVQDHQGFANAKDVTPDANEPKRNPILASLDAAEEPGDRLPSEDQETAEDDLGEDADFLNEMGAMPSEEEMAMAETKAREAALAARED
ncbi:MAG: hypothetical protein AAF968_10200 [Pseudomonadota bacterium]